MPSNNSKAYDTPPKVWNPARFPAQVEEVSVDAIVGTFDIVVCSLTCAVPAQGYKPVAHAKTIFTELTGCGGAVMYVGSHNISKVP